MHRLQVTEKYQVAEMNYLAWASLSFAGLRISDDAMASLLHSIRDGSQLQSYT